MFSALSGHRMALGMAQRGKKGALVHAHTTVSPTQGGELQRWLCGREGLGTGDQARIGPKIESSSCTARPSVTWKSPLSGSRPCQQQLGRAAYASEGRAQAFIRAWFSHRHLGPMVVLPLALAPPPHLEHFAYLSQVPKQCLLQPFLGFWSPVCAGAPGRAVRGCLQGQVALSTTL